MTHNPATTDADPITTFMNMVKKEIQTITDPDEMQTLGAVIAHVLAPEPEDNAA